jgi:hypothetical protein
MCHICLPKPPQMLEDVMNVLGDVMAFQGQRPGGKGTTPPGYRSAQLPLVKHPPLPRCKSSDLSLLPAGVSTSIWWALSPMEVRTNHLPMCTYPSGMILHINRYALHGLISHKDHSNVNHIQSSILLNMCIKPLLLSQVLKDIILICKPSLEEETGRPIGLLLIGCGMFPGEIKSKSC